MFDTCSYFIDDKALFGSFPSQTQVNALEKFGVRVFVDLTTPTENVISYNTEYTYISYPILDRNIPVNHETFCAFIFKLCTLLDELGSGEKMYVHCKGGHGRSGVVVAAILGVYEHLSPYDALEKTYKCHQTRKIMRDKWRAIGSPQTQKQKQFIHQILGSISIDDIPIYDAFKSLDENTKLFLKRSYLKTFTSTKYDQNVVDLYTQFKSEIYKNIWYQKEPSRTW